MRRLAYITQCFPSREKPYYCYYLYQQMKALEKLGYHITIIQPDSNFRDGDVYEDQFQDMQVIHIGLNLSGVHKVMGMLNRTSGGFCRSLNTVCSKELFQIVLMGLCSRDVYCASINTAKRHHAISVLHLHGLDAYETYYVSHRKAIAMANHYFSKMNMKKADAVIGVSDKVCENVRSGMRKDALYTVYNGADPTVFFPKKEKFNPEFTIISVANFNPIKGHKYLIEAIKQIQIMRPQCHLNIRFIGKGIMEDELKKAAEGTGIIFCGEMQYDHVAEEMKNADFYIMPSYYEAIGCVYFEAMLSGVAVLGVKGCGIDEIITDRENGYLVSPQNSQEIIDAILFALDQPSKHTEIAQNGYATAIEHYTWEHSAEELDSVLTQIMQNTSR